MAPSLPHHSHPCSPWLSSPTAPPRLSKCLLQIRVCALGVGIGLPCPGLGSRLQVSLWPGMEPDPGSREGKGSTAVELLPPLHSGSWSAAPEPTGQHSSYINATFIITMSSAANLWVSHPVKDSQLSGPNCPHHNAPN